MTARVLGPREMCRMFGIDPDAPLDPLDGFEKTTLGKLLPKRDSFAPTPAPPAQTEETMSDNDCPDCKRLFCGPCIVHSPVPPALVKRNGYTVRGQVPVKGEPIRNGLGHTEAQQAALDRGEMVLLKSSFIANPAKGSAADWQARAEKAEAELAALDREDLQGISLNNELREVLGCKPGESVVDAARALKHGAGATCAHKLDEYVHRDELKAANQRGMAAIARADAESQRAQAAAYGVGDLCNTITELRAEVGRLSMLAKGKR